MSFSSVLPYVRSRLEALGYDEHPDAFNPDNVPSTDFDTTYHVELLPSIPQRRDHTSEQINVPFRIRIYYKLLRSTNEGRDEVVAIADTVYDEVIAAQNRLGEAVKSVEFDFWNIEQLADSNDNAVKLVMEFTAIVTKSTGRTGE